METYIVAALTASLPKYEQCFIATEDDVIITTHSRVFGPDTNEACKKWMAKNCADKDNWYWLTVAQYALIFVVTLAFVGVIIWGAFTINDLRLVDPGTNTQTDVARNLITFLVAVAVVAIALLATLTAMVIREMERFALAKEVLSLMVGILGTIIGFYFGQAASQNKPAAPTPTPTVQASPSPTATASPTATTNSAPVR